MNVEVGRVEAVVFNAGSEVVSDGPGSDVVKAVWPMVVTRTVTVGMTTVTASVTVDRTTCVPTWVTTTSLPRSVLVEIEGSSCSVRETMDSEKVTCSIAVAIVRVMVESEVAKGTVLSTARKESRGCLRSIAAAWKEWKGECSKECKGLDRERACTRAHTVQVILERRGPSAQSPRESMST